MTDLISRLAARAVGASASAQPRVRSLFEPRLLAVDVDITTMSRDFGGLAHDGHDDVDTTPVAPRPPGRELSPPGGEMPARPPRQRWSADDRPEVEPRPRSAAVSADRPSRVGRGSSVARTGSPSEQHLDRRSAVGATRPKVVMPAVSQPSAASPIAAVAADPAVRIHIGRLDIRANVPTPAPLGGAAPAGRAEPTLSLEDYLNGKRSAHT